MEAMQDQAKLVSKMNVVNEAIKNVLLQPHYLSKGVVPTRLESVCRNGKIECFCTIELSQVIANAGLVNLEFLYTLVVQDGKLHFSFYLEKLIEVEKFYVQATGLDRLQRAIDDLSRD